MRGVLLVWLGLLAVAPLTIGCAPTEGHIKMPELDETIDVADVYTTTAVTNVTAPLCTADLSQLQAQIEQQLAYFSAYRVQYDDGFTITVLEHPEWTTRVTVLRDGNIRFGFLNEPVPVINLTFQEIEDLVKEKLKKYFYEPQIKISDISQADTSYTVRTLGAFNKPGRSKIQAGFRLWDAIADAGGFINNRSALTVSETTPQLPTVDLSRAVLLREVRFVPEGTAPAGMDLRETDVVRLGIDFRELVSGDPMHNLPLFPGDVIYVPPFEPENSRVIVIGEVGTPGVFYYRERMNLIEALARAGWINETNAKYSGIYLVRNSLGTDDQRELYILNPINVVKGRARNFNLRNGDIIYVDTDSLTDINIVLSKITPFFNFPVSGINTFKAIRDIDK